MACPGGCAAAAASRSTKARNWPKNARAKLYQLDRKAPLRFSHENPAIKRLYSEYLGAPLSERAHHLLHTDHTAWQMPLAPRHRQGQD